MMTYKTINLDPLTYDRLLLYKHGKMTFDEVIINLMDKISEEEFYMGILEEHRKTVKEMKKGDCLTQEELDDLLDMGQ